MTDRDDDERVDSAQEDALRRDALLREAADVEHVLRLAAARDGDPASAARRRLAARLAQGPQPARHNAVWLGVVFAAAAALVVWSWPRGQSTPSTSAPGYRLEAGGVAAHLGDPSAPPRVRPGDTLVLRLLPERQTTPIDAVRVAVRADGGMRPLAVDVDPQPGGGVLLRAVVESTWASTPGLHAVEVSVGDESCTPGGSAPCWRGEVVLEVVR